MDPHAAPARAGRLVGLQDIGRAGDLLVVALVLAITVAAAVWAAAPSGMGPAGIGAAVITGPSGRTVVDLGTDADHHIEGRLGTVLVRVSDGRVRVVDSPCPDKHCVAAGAIEQGAVICAPSGVSVRVDGGGEGALDAVLR